MVKREKSRDEGVKSHVFTLRVTSRLADLIKKSARDSGLSVNEWIIRLIISDTGHLESKSLEEVLSTVSVFPFDDRTIYVDPERFM